MSYYLFPFYLIKLKMLGEEHILLSSSIFNLSSLMSLLREMGELCRYGNGIRVGGSGLNSRQEEQIFLYSTASRPDLGPTQHPIQWVLGGYFSPGVIWSWREADHSPPSSAEIKNVGAIPKFLHVTIVRCLIN
jgi:hypothetical protein